MNKTYISYVIQSAEAHVHDFAVVDLPRSQVAIYKDTTAEEVYKWSVEQQAALKAGEKLIVLSHFIVH